MRDLPLHGNCITADKGRLLGSTGGRLLLGSHPVAIRLRRNNINTVPDLPLRGSRIDADQGRLLGSSGGRLLPGIPPVAIRIHRNNISTVHDLYLHGSRIDADQGRLLGTSGGRLLPSIRPVAIHLRRNNISNVHDLPLKCSRIDADHGRLLGSSGGHDMGCNNGPQAETPTETASPTLLLSKPPTAVDCRAAPTSTTSSGLVAGDLDLVFPRFSSLELLLRAAAPTTSPLRCETSIELSAGSTASETGSRATTCAPSPPLSSPMEMSAHRSWLGALPRGCSTPSPEVRSKYCTAPLGHLLARPAASAATSRAKSES